MKNWLSNQVQNQPPSQTGSALLTQFKADVDQLISHPSQANWPADQRVTHATQLLEIASDEGFTDQIPDYQLDWINQRSKAYV